MRLRNRIVKGTFWTDPDLLRWPMGKRLFYQSLWALADDSCCIEDDMFGVKVAAWPSPLDSKMSVALFRKWRDELVEDGKLIAYEAAGHKCLYLPRMAEHEKPRNPQSPDVSLPPWVIWVANSEDKRKGHYEHGSVVEGSYDRATTPPALPCPVLPCSVLPSPEEDNPLSLPDRSPDGVPEDVLGYWESKVCRSPREADLKSLRTLCKNFSAGVVKIAIGQAVVQGEAADNFALITTIARAEARL